MPTQMPGWDNVHHLVEIVISLLEIGNFGSLRKKRYLEGRFQNSPDDSTLPNLGIRITVHLTRTSTARKEQIISVPQDNNDEIDTSSPPPWKFDTWKNMRIVPIHHHQRPPGKFQRIRSQVWSDLINWSRDSRWVTKARAVDSSDDVSWTTMSKDNAFHSSVSWCGHRNSMLSRWTSPPWSVTRSTQRTPQTLALTTRRWRSRRLSTLVVPSSRVSSPILRKRKTENGKR